MKKYFLLGILLPVSALAFGLKSPDLEKSGFTKSYEANQPELGCNGENWMPELVWSNPPRETQSFVITLIDPDAPVQGGWSHWNVLHIPGHFRSFPNNAIVTHLESDIKPSISPIVTALNDYGEMSFGGVCPPKGDNPHHYIFTIYALKTPNLSINGHILNEKASPHLIEYLLTHSNNILGKTSITYTYKR